MDKYQQRIEAAFLSKCTSQIAYEWLSEHRYNDEEDGTPRSIEPQHVLEYILIRRNDPFIDLGIARYGHSHKAIRHAFKRGNIGVRCAALTNPHVGACVERFLKGWLDADDIMELIHNSADVELESLVKNKYLNDATLEQLIEKKDAFADLTEVTYLRILTSLGGNPRMSAEYDAVISDGWAEHQYEKIFSLAWDLARSFPATRDHACVLYQLLESAKLPIGYKNPEEVIKRWRIEEGSEESDYGFSYSYYLRSRLADVMEPNDHLLNSNDRAVRESFYRRFATWKYKDWSAFIERDGEYAFNAMANNDEFWRDANMRRSLHNLAQKVPDPKNHMTVFDTYDRYEFHLRKKHPEWFTEEEVEYANGTDAIIQRLEKKIDQISDSISNDDIPIYEELKYLIEKLEPLLEDLKYSTPDNQSGISQELEGLQEEFQELKITVLGQQEIKTSLWPWVITISLLIILFFK